MAVARVSLLRLLAMLLVSVIAACIAGDGPSFLSAPEDLPLDSVMRLRSDSFGLAVGDEVTIVATAQSLLGDSSEQRGLYWLSDEPGVAVVDPYGTVRAQSPGTARISAIADDGRRADIQVFVTANLPPIARLLLSPSVTTLAAGANARIAIQALDSAGVPIAGVVPAFSSDSPHVATVRVTTTRTRELNQVYVVSALRAGTSHLTATVSGMTATARVVVTPVAKPVVQIVMSPASVALIAGDSLRVAAQAVDEAGHSVTNAVVAFSSDDPAIAAIDQNGTVTALRAGVTRISASSRGMSVHAAVLVAPRVTQLSLLPVAPVVVGSTSQLTARALDANGRDVPNAPITFVIRDPGIATINASGLVTGVSVGMTLVTVSSQYLTATTGIAVSPRPVSQVIVAPTALSLVAGATAQLSVEARDATSAIVSGAAITFASTDASIASVSASGLVTAVAAGTAQITVSSEGVSTVVAVVVSRRPVSQVVVAPSALSLVAGTTAQLTAEARDATDAIVTGAVITFVSSAAAISSVSASGLVTAVAAGTAQITVSSNGVSSSVTVLVSPRPVSQVTVSPSSLDLTVGAASQLSAQARDAAGALVNGAVVTFVSDAPAVATVDGTGGVIALAPGSTTIRASSNGISAGAAIRVQAPPTGLVIDVAPGTAYQTISGWEATAEIGSTECNAAAYQVYRNPLLDRAVNELGINRVRLEIKSGVEHPIDHFAQWQSGQLSTAAFNAARYLPVNDNSDPFDSDANGFRFSSVDHTVEQVINPLRQRLAARGEHLMVSLNFVDFKSSRSAFNQMEAPAEYAEVITAAFQHINQKYGWVPDAVELLLEPENTPWSANQLGQALVSTAARLKALGFSPEFIGPSTMASAAAPAYWDGVRAVPGAASLLTELSYHRYDAVTPQSLEAIGARRTAHNVRTSMLEHIGSDIDDLIEDLTIAGVSAWQQFALAFCLPTDDGSAYYVIDESSPGNPTVRLSATGRTLSQVFRYVRSGAVRIGASSANSSLASTVAFRNTNGKHVVIVRTYGAQQLQVRGLPPGTYGVSYGTSAGTDQPASDVHVAPGGAVSVAIPAGGAITIFAR